MKKILFLLLFVPFCAFSQSNNIFIEKNTVVWKLDLQENFTDYSKKSELNPKMEITKSNDTQFRGVAKNLKCSCNNGNSAFLKEEFDADFIVDFQNNKITISVFNLRFKNYVYYAFATVRAKEENQPVEKFFLKKDGTLKTNKQTVKDSDCLNKYLTSIFE